MRCYNEVEVNCPRCGTVNKLQSNGGSCNFSNNKLHAADIQDQIGVRGRWYCQKCSKPFEILIQSIVQIVPVGET